MCVPVIRLRTWNRSKSQLEPSYWISECWLHNVATDTVAVTGGFMMMAVSVSVKVSMRFHFKANSHRNGWKHGSVTARHRQSQHTLLLRIRSNRFFFHLPNKFAIMMLYSDDFYCLCDLKLSINCLCFGFMFASKSEYVCRCCSFALVAHFEMHLLFGFSFLQMHFRCWLPVANALAMNEHNFVI